MKIAWGDVPDASALRQQRIRLRRKAMKKVKQWMNAFKKKKGRLPNIEERIIEPQFVHRIGFETT